LPEKYGAVGDGTTDDTTALQAALDAAVAARGRVVLGPKTYKITAALTIPETWGWSIQGAGRVSTTILQATDNVPIFNLGASPQDSMHSWSITDLCLTYVNAQPSTNTAANSILFSAMGYEGTLRAIQFSKGCYGIKVVSGVGGPWGCSWDELWFTGLTGGAMDWTGAINAVPNNVWGRMLIQCDNMVGPVFKNIKGYNFTIGALEFLTANLGQQLFLLADGAQVTIGAIKLEVGAYTANQSIFNFTGTSKVKIGQLFLGGTVLSVAGSGVTVNVTASGSGGVLDIDFLTVAATSITGGAALYAATGSSPASIQIGSYLLSGGALLVNQGSSTTGEILTVRSHVLGRLLTMGDVSYTFTLGGPNKARFNVPFTAARTIDLPLTNTSLFNGLYYECIFNGAINGANTATIRCNGVTLNTQTTDKAVLGYTYQRGAASPQSGWILTKYETLP
jgi:hypothetical protein